MRLFLLIALVPIVELILLIELGRRIGTGPTLLWVLVTGALGAVLAKSQGFATMRRVQRQMAQGQMPAEGLVDGLLILVGGAMLLTPGILTDGVGFAFILPFTRLRIKTWLRRKLERWVQAGTFRIYVR